MAGLNHQARGELDGSLRGARAFQIIPIRMKRATTVRKVTLMMATVRNASPADRGVMAYLTRCEPRSL